MPRTCRLIALNMSCPISPRLQPCIEGRPCHGWETRIKAWLWLPKDWLPIVPQERLCGCRGSSNCLRTAIAMQESRERGLDEAACLIEATQIGAAEAGLYRSRGELLLVVGDRAAAEVSFVQAI